MANYSIVTDGVVSNVYVSDTQLDPSWVLCNEGVSVGWEYDGTNFRSPHRKYRNDLLKETDFHALSDVTMSSEMTTYRQALRDLPAQEGFPDTITWPIKPE
jgi:hypothetical protein